MKSIKSLKVDLLYDCIRFLTEERANIKAIHYEAINLILLLHQTSTDDLLNKKLADKLADYDNMITFLNGIAYDIRQHKEDEE